MEEGGPARRGHGTQGRVGGRVETWIMFSLESHKRLGIKCAGLFQSGGYCLSRELSVLCTPGTVCNPG